MISASATDEKPISLFRRSKPQLLQLAKDFRDPDHPLRIVVVKDMWLTGFDAPVLHTLYIDKPMRDHGLLQAIARVNRVFREKSGGLVVDYIGIGEDLRASLRAYDETELEDPAIPIAQAIAGLWEKYEVLCAMLYPAGYRKGELNVAADPSRLILDCWDYVLADEQRIREFLDEQAALAKWYTLIGTQQAVIDLREEISFFKKLAGEVRKIATPVLQASAEAEQAVRQFMSEGLAAGEVIETLALADQDRPDISVLSEEFLDSIAAKTEHPNIQIRLLEKLLKNEVKSRSRTNQAQAKLFAEQLDAVLHRYELRQISSAEVVQRLVEIARSLREARPPSRAARPHGGGGRLLRRARRWRRRAATSTRSSQRSRETSSRASGKTSPSTGLTAHRPRLRSAARSSASYASTSTSRQLRRPGAEVSRTSTTSPSSCSTRPRLSTDTGQTSRAGCSNRSRPHHRVHVGEPEGTYLERR